MVVAQFDCPSETVVAADFGTALTASERQATEIELLRGEERTRRPAVANFTDHASDKVWYRVNQKFSTEKVGDAPSWRVLRNISLRSSSTLKARGGRGGIDRGKWRGILALGYEKSGTICGAGLIGSIAYPQ